MPASAALPLCFNRMIGMKVIRLSSIPIQATVQLGADRVIPILDTSTIPNLVLTRRFRDISFCACYIRWHLSAIISL